MSDDDKNFLVDMLKTRGWEVYESLNTKMVEQYRFLATQQNVKLEDRLWYSALAQGREEAVKEVKSIV
jgi:hypothetical protein